MNFDPDTTTTCDHLACGLRIVRGDDGTTWAHWPTSSSPLYVTAADGHDATPGDNDG